MASLGHGHEPLVGQHRLDHRTGAGAARHHELVLLGLDQQAQRLQVGHDRLAGIEAVEAAVLFRRVVVDGGVQRQHADDRQLVAQAHCVVVVVVRRRDLDHAGAEFLVHVVVGNHRDEAVHQRQLDLLAHQVLVALVLGMHHHRHVAQHGLRARGGDRERAAAVGQRVGDVPEEAVFFLALDFQVADRGLDGRVPVDQALAAIDQALVVELHEGLGDHLRQLVVHGEVLAAPVHRVAHAAHLAGDGVAGLLLPFPDLRDEVLAAQVVAAELLLLQLALHHDLRGDAGVVRARQPQRVGALHAVVARQAVHDRLVEGMAHVQGAGDVGRRQLDGEGGRAVLGRLACRGSRPARSRAAPIQDPSAPRGQRVRRIWTGSKGRAGSGCRSWRVRRCKEERHPAGCRRWVKGSGRQFYSYPAMPPIIRRCCSSCLPPSPWTTKAPSPPSCPRPARTSKRPRVLRWS